MIEKPYRNRLLAGAAALTFFISTVVSPAAPSWADGERQPEEDQNQPIPRRHPAKAPPVDIPAKISGQLADSLDEPPPPLQQSHDAGLDETQALIHAQKIAQNLGVGLQDVKKIRFYRIEGKDPSSDVGFEVVLRAAGSGLPQRPLNFAGFIEGGKVLAWETKFDWTTLEKILKVLKNSYSVSPQDIPRQNIMRFSGIPEQDPRTSRQAAFIATRPGKKITLILDGATDPSRLVSPSAYLESFPPPGEPAPRQVDYQVIWHRGSQQRQNFLHPLALQAVTKAIGSDIHITGLDRVEYVDSGSRITCREAGCAAWSGTLSVTLNAGHGNRFYTGTITALFTRKQGTLNYDIRLSETEPLERFQSLERALASLEGVDAGRVTVYAQQQQELEAPCPAEAPDCTSVYGEFYSIRRSPNGPREYRRIGSGVVQHGDGTWSILGNTHSEEAADTQAFRAEGYHRITESREIAADLASRGFINLTYNDIRVGLSARRDSGSPDDEPSSHAIAFYYGLRYELSECPGAGDGPCQMLLLDADGLQIERADRAPEYQVENFRLAMPGTRHATLEAAIFAQRGFPNNWTGDITVYLQEEQANTSPLTQDRKIYKVVWGDGSPHLPYFTGTATKFSDGTWVPGGFKASSHEEAFLAKGYKALGIAPGGPGTLTLSAIELTSETSPHEFMWEKTYRIEYTLKWGAGPDQTVYTAEGTFDGRDGMRRYGISLIPDQVEALRAELLSIFKRQIEEQEARVKELQTRLADQQKKFESEKKAFLEKIEDLKKKLTDLLASLPESLQDESLANEIKTFKSEVTSYLREMPGLWLRQRIQEETNPPSLKLDVEIALLFLEREIIPPNQFLFPALEAQMLLNELKRHYQKITDAKTLEELEKLRDFQPPNFHVAYDPVIEMMGLKPTDPVKSLTALVETGQKLLARIPPTEIELPEGTLVLDRTAKTAKLSHKNGDTLTFNQLYETLSPLDSKIPEGNKVIAAYQNREGRTVYVTLHPYRIDHPDGSFEITLSHHGVHLLFDLQGLLADVTVYDESLNELVNAFLTSRASDAAKNEMLKKILKMAKRAEDSMDEIQEEPYRKALQAYLEALKRRLGSPQNPREVDFENLYHSFTADLEAYGGKALQRVIRSREEFDEVWNNLIGTVHFDNGAPLPPPEIDFDNRMVLMVVDVTHSTGGSDVRIASVTIEDGEMIVRVASKSPKPGEFVTMAFSRPVHFVTVPKSGLPVRFTSASGPALPPPSPLISFDEEGLEVCTIGTLLGPARTGEPVCRALTEYERTVYPSLAVSPSEFGGTQFEHYADLVKDRGDIVAGINAAADTVVFVIRPTHSSGSTPTPQPPLSSAGTWIAHLSHDSAAVYVDARPLGDEKSIRSRLFRAVVVKASEASNPSARMYARAGLVTENEFNLTSFGCPGGGYCGNLGPETEYIAWIEELALGSDVQSRNAVVLASSIPSAPFTTPPAPNRLPDPGVRAFPVISGDYLCIGSNCRNHDQPARIIKVGENDFRLINEFGDESKGYLPSGTQILAANWLYNDRPLRGTLEINAQNEAVKIIWENGTAWEKRSEQTDPIPQKQMEAVVVQRNSTVYDISELPAGIRLVPEGNGFLKAVIEDAGVAEKLRQQMNYSIYPHPDGFRSEPGNFWVVVVVGPPPPPRNINIGGPMTATASIRDGELYVEVGYGPQQGAYAYLPWPRSAMMDVALIQVQGADRVLTLDKIHISRRPPGVWDFLVPGVEPPPLTLENLAPLSSGGGDQADPPTEIQVQGGGEIPAGTLTIDRPNETAAIGTPNGGTYSYSRLSESTDPHDTALPEGNQILGTYVNGDGQTVYVSGHQDRIDHPDGSFERTFHHHGVIVQFNPQGQITDIMLFDESVAEMVKQDPGKALTMIERIKAAAQEEASGDELELILSYLNRQKKTAEENFAIVQGVRVPGPAQSPNERFEVTAGEKAKIAEVLNVASDQINAARLYDIHRPDQRGTDLLSIDVNRLNERKGLTVELKDGRKYIGIRTLLPVRCVGAYCEYGYEFFEDPAGQGPSRGEYSPQSPVFGDAARYLGVSVDDIATIRYSRDLGPLMADPTSNGIIVTLKNGTQYGGRYTESWGLIRASMLLFPKQSDELKTQPDKDKKNVIDTLKDALDQAVATLKALTDKLKEVTGDVLKALLDAIKSATDTINTLVKTIASLAGGDQQPVNPQQIDSTMQTKPDAGSNASSSSLLAKGFNECRIQVGQQVIGTPSCEPTTRPDSLPAQSQNSAFQRELINAVANYFHIDPSKVYLTGKLGLINGWIFLIDNSSSNSGQQRGQTQVADTPAVSSTPSASIDGDQSSQPSVKIETLPANKIDKATVILIPRTFDSEGRLLSEAIPGGRKVSIDWGHQEATITDGEGKVFFYSQVELDHSSGDNYELFKFQSPDRTNHTVYAHLDQITRLDGSITITLSHREVQLNFNPQTKLTSIIYKGKNLSELAGDELREAIQKVRDAIDERQKGSNPIPGASLEQVNALLDEYQKIVDAARELTKQNPNPVVLGVFAGRTAKSPNGRFEVFEVTAKLDSRTRGPVALAVTDHETVQTTRIGSTQFPELGWEGNRLLSYAVDDEGNVWVSMIEPLRPENWQQQEITFYMIPAGGSKRVKLFPGTYPFASEPPYTYSKRRVDGIEEVKNGEDIHSGRRIGPEGFTGSAIYLTDVRGSKYPPILLPGRLRQQGNGGYPLFS